VPLELYIRTKDPQYLPLGKKLADQQWDKPGRTAHGRNALLGRRHVHDHDPSGPGLPSHGNKVYLDRAALEMVAYLDKLQKPNGLFFHGPEIPFYWGRATDGSRAVWPNCSRICRRTTPSARASCKAISR